MKRILAISDEVSETLYGPRLKELDVELVVSCGDLPFDYLEFIVSVLNVPLAYVLGNHDPAPARPSPQALGAPFVRSEEASFGPEGCVSVEGRVVQLAGLRVAGLGGSVRYRAGPHQYSEKEMGRRARRLGRRARNEVDVLITHSPPAGLGDCDDLAHRGFTSFHDLARTLSPQVMVHGHIHPYGHRRVDHDLNGVPVLNAVGYRVVELAG